MANVAVVILGLAIAGGASSQGEIGAALIGAALMVVGAWPVFLHAVAEERWAMVTSGLVALLAMGFIVGAISTSGAGSSSSTSQGPSRGTANDPRPGKPEVYAAIAAETSCVELQKTFDRNMDDFDRREVGTHLADVVLSYAVAADERMREIGCHG